MIKGGGCDEQSPPKKTKGVNMFITSGNETVTPFGVLKPFYVYELSSDFINRLNSDNKRCMEISAKPELINKKYFAGCVKNGDNIIIKRLGGAGDVIWTLPVARQLKKLYPDCKITYWIAEHHFDLVKNNPYIDGVMSNPTIKQLDPFNWILDYYESIERYNPAENEEAYDLHWKWAFNEEPKDDLMGNIFLTETEIKDAENVFGKNYIVVSMSSSNPKRTYFQMPIVIEKLIEEHNCNIIVTGQGSFNVPEKPKIKNMINKLNLRELLAIINNAKLVIAADSGNIHFAGQLGVKTIGLYSTAHATTRTKYYKNLEYIQSCEWCAPCLKLAEPCAKDGECLSRINTDTVVNLIGEAL